MIDKLESITDRLYIIAEQLQKERQGRPLRLPEKLTQEEYIWLADYLLKQREILKNE